MCGIMGYLGFKDATKPVIEGLSRLEYRGYDSAGISYLVDKSFQTFKKEGKLVNLKSILSQSPIQSSIALGHTRWATHGKVNDTNAHPHQNDYFSIVHNGIIENASEIKSNLKSDYNFITQTDTESFLALLTENFSKFKNVRKAIAESFKRIKGNSAFVILHQESQCLWAIKKSAPLVCGYNQISGDTYVSSDPYALIGFADKVYFPSDDVLCELSLEQKDKISFFELDGKKSDRFELQEKKLEQMIADKAGYEHYMLKEIHEQPSLIRSILNFYNSGLGKDYLATLERDYSRINISACGTALHAGYLIKKYIERINKLPVSIDFASEFRYSDPLILEGDLGLFISQSGETADTLACQELCSSHGLKTLAIVNVQGSSLYRSCHNKLLTQAGVEIGVASTKAFTMQVLVGLILAYSMNKKLDLKDLEDEFLELSHQFENVLKEKDEIINIASKIYQKQGFIYTGRGEQYPIALEGALKLKEIAYVHAEGYAAGELKHGPISLIDSNMVNIAIVTPDLFDKTLSNAQEVKARNGIMVIIGEKDNNELQELADYYIGLNLKKLKHTKPLLTNLVLQLLSYYIAKEKGTDIDKPRNLAKSVTVE